MPDIPKAAEDVAQTVFLNVVRTKRTGAGRYQRELGTVKGWLNGILYRELANLFHGIPLISERDLAMNDDGDRDKAGSVIDVAPGQEPEADQPVIEAEEAVRKAQLATRVRKERENLPEPFRTILWMKFWLEMNNREIWKAIWGKGGEVQMTPNDDVKMARMIKKALNMSRDRLL